MLTAAKVSGVVGWGLVGFGGYLVLAGGAFSGIWLAVIGWMVLQSSTAERRVLEWRANLRGVTFRQVMSAPPPTIAVWTPVRDVVEAGRQSATPFHVVADGAGVARGVVTLIDATRVAMMRPDLAVGELVRPLVDGAVAGPDEQVSAVLGVRIVQLPVLVRDGEGRIIGQVRPEDLSRWGAGVRPHDQRHPSPLLPRHLLVARPGRHRGPRSRWWPRKGAAGGFKRPLSGNITTVAGVDPIVKRCLARPVGQMAHFHAAGREFRFLAVPPRPRSTILTVS